MTRALVISENARASRRRASIQALLATLIKPAGAHTNTQSPHILSCTGVLTTSSFLLARADAQPAFRSVPSGRWFHRAERSISLCRIPSTRISSTAWPKE